MRADAAIALVILVPLLGTVLTSLVRGRAAAAIAALAALFTVLAASLLTLEVAASGGVALPVGGWQPPLGIQLRADGLAVVLLLVTGLVGLAATGYAIWLSLGPHELGGFLPLWLLCWAALDGLILSADIFNLYVTLELMSIAAVALVALAGAGDARTASLRYLLLAFVGSLPYLAGVALLYGAYGTLDIGLLSQRISAGPLAWIALALMSGGLAVKAALFPLHGWLPPAHASALPPVSAVLSGLVVKGAFFIFLRLWIDLFGGLAARGAAQLVGALGAAAVVFGSILAMQQTRLKQLVAYSTVAQIGYLFLLFPLASGAARAGGVLLAVSHGAAKASLFMAAGTVSAAAGSDHIDKLPGTARHLPFSFFAIALASMSLLGMPPSGGFVGKWLLLRAALEEGQWWWALVVLSGSLLTAGYLFRILRRAFAPLPEGGAALRQVSRSAELVALALAGVAIWIGMLAALPLGLLRWPGGM